jgi:hypothetical protein
MDINSRITSCTEIVPGLWLGNEAASQDIKFLRENNIKLVMNCSKNIPASPKGSGVQKIFRIPIDDPGPLITPSRNSDNLSMVVLIPQAVSIIHEHLLRGPDAGAVLVHCHAGAQRSASVVVYYLMKHGQFKMSRGRALQLGMMSAQDRKRVLYKSAVAYIVSKRPIVYYGGMHNNFRYAIDQLQV